MTGHPALSSRAAGILSWAGHVDRLLAVEAALARAQAGVGLVPPAAADAIAAACAAGIDRDALDAEAAADATPVIPLVRQLRAAVGEDHGRWVHHGATSQDVVDTALVLQVRDATDLLVEELWSLGSACARLADEHRSTLMVGRTLLQHAVPVTFGLKAAHWLSLVTRHVARLRDARAALPVQLGSAAGTLAPYGDQGLELAERFAEELGLAAPALPWHTDRDVLHDAVARVALAAGSLGKIAGDLVSLAQTEVGELSDPGAGGSSTMPHKRNPMDAVFAVASSRLALAAAAGVFPLALQEHERAAGAWQAEWVAVPRVLDHAVAAAERVRATVERVEVDAVAMRANLDRTSGAIMAEAVALALAPALGRAEASRVVAEALDAARRDGHTLRDALGDDPRVRGAVGDRLDALVEPSSYLGSAVVLVERALARWAELD